MKIAPVVCLLSALLVSSCKDNGIPTSPQLDPDEPLRQSLVGHWNESDFFTVSFRSDGSFADTSLTIAAFGSAPMDTMHLYRSCGYSVKDSVVSYSDVKFGYKSASGKSWPGFSDSPLPQLLRVSANSLQMIPTKVLGRVSPSNSQAGLPGTWKSITWTSVFGSDSLNAENISRLEVLYSFAAGSATYSETWNYLDLPQIGVQTYYGTYQYSSPNLFMSKDSDTTRARVVFTTASMYWIYDQWVHTLVRTF